MKTPLSFSMVLFCRSISKQAESGIILLTIITKVDLGGGDTTDPLHKKLRGGRRSITCNRIIYLHT